ncbi:MAG: hypothetical protein IJK51_06875 [Bacteroidaceae bacterium]|nr:hypothetical protein [Bacteroidaceae bacterium]
MKQVFNKVWLRVCMLVAVMTTAFAGTAWAEDVTATLTKFTAASGKVDPFVTYSTTGALSGHAITVPASSDKFTVSLTAEALTYGSKIHSIEFVASDAHAWHYSVDNGSNQNLSSSKTITVSGLDCESVAFSHDYTYTNLTIQSVTVTYTAPVFPYTVTAEVNEEGWGTIQSVVGNVITAKPTMGYVFAEPAYTVTEGTATVTQNGNEFAVTEAAEGTTVKVTINFDRSSVSPEYKVDFESALTSYEESWVFSGVEQSNYIYHAGENCGRAHNGSTITTTTKITSPGTLTFYARGGADATATWSVNVSSDGTNWGDAVTSKSITGTSYQKVEVNLGEYSDVYVRISCSANSGSYAAIDDIDLTTLASLIKVSVSSYGYATFCCDRALDFTNSGIQVSYLTLDGTRLVYNPINIVGAGVPVVLVKAGGTNGEVEIPVTTETPDEVPATNVLRRGQGSSVILTYSATNKVFILYADATHNIGFYRANESTVAMDRAYVVIDSDVNVKSFVFDENATGIEAIHNAAEGGAIYNLAGQRLQKMQKGINIVNGKKVLF